MKHLKHLFTALLLMCGIVTNAHEFEVNGIYYRTIYSNATSINVEISELTGAFTASNNNGTWHSCWESSNLPGFSFLTSANNIKLDQGWLAGYSGNSGTSTYTITAPTGYVVTAIQFNYTNTDEGTHTLQLEIDGSTYTSSSITNSFQKTLSNPQQSFSFTQKGDNKGITFSNLIVTVETKNNVEVTYKGDSENEYSNEYTGNIVIPENITITTKETETQLETIRENLGDWTSTNQGKDNTTSDNEYSFTVTAGATLSFNWSVSSESGYDELIVILDNETILEQSGEKSGTYRKDFDTAGTHRLTVKYTKDGSNRSGNDQGKIYNVILEQDIEIEKAVEVEYYVVGIGNNAFYNCTGITEITIPNSVTSIGNEAFYGCSSLKTIINNSNLVFEKGSTANGYVAYYADNIVTSIKQISELKNDKLYHIGTARGSWIVADGRLKSTAILGVPKDFTDTRQQFSIYSSNGQKYLYYPAENKFINKDGSLGFIPVDDISFSAGLKTDEFVAYFDDSHYVNLNSSEGVVINSWKTVDEGNSCTIMKVGEFAGVSLDEFIFEVINGVNTLIGYFGNDVNVVLPDNYNGENYVIGAEAFKGNTTLTSITIPNSVTSIGGSAFSGCSGLTSITIPNSVTSIGNNAFSGCNKLSIVNLNTTTVQNWFSGFTSLKEIILGNGVTSIEDNAFNGCTNIIRIEINTTTVSNWFNNLSSLREVVIGNNVKKIEREAFAYCVNLSSLTIGTKVESISSDYPAFEGCNNIDKIYWLPNTPPQGHECLNGKINYVANNNYDLNNIEKLQLLSSRFEVDGIVFIPKDLSTGVCCVVDYNPVKNLNYVVIDDTISYKGVKLTVEDIMPYSFYNNNSIKTLILKNKGNIGEFAFYNNDALKNLRLKNNGSIKESAFEECNSLDSVNIPQCITSVGDYAFRKCEKLTTAKIADRTTVLPLGCRLFDEGALENLYIGAKIEYINEVGHEASPFCENKTLKNVVITDIEDHIYDYEFYNCSALKTVTVGDGVERIGKWAFSGCGVLSEFVFGSNVSSIGEEAFSDCISMTKISGRAILPPVCESQALDDINKWDCTLYVPERNREQYRSADQWKQFQFVENLVTEDNYVTYVIDGNVYKTLLLTPGNRIIAPYVGDREDGKPFLGWDLEDYMQFVTIPANSTAQRTITRSTTNNVIETEIDLAGNANAMLYTNAPCTNTQYGDQFNGWNVLFDNDATTFFHSEYGNKQTPDALDHYIRVDMGVGNSIGEFKFTYTNRNGVNMGVAPSTIVVEGSNSENGAYTEIVTLTGLSNKSSEKYTSEKLGSDDVKYRYIRFRVTATHGGQKDNNHPYFAISEFGISRFDYETLEPEPELEPEPDYTITMPIMPDKDITIYGTYIKSQCVLTYMVDGEVYRTFTYKPGDKITPLKEPKKNGYVFSGWSEIPATMPEDDFVVTGTFTMEKTTVTLNKTNVEIAIGDTITLVATVKPDVAPDKNVIWSSSNPKIATVENGVVKALYLGEVTIIATVGDVKAECVVKVLKEVAVDEITLDKENINRVIYDLKGNRILDVENLEKGIYIIDGKKVLLGNF